MSVTGTTAGLPATLAMLVNDSMSVRQNQSVLTQQAASGKVSDTYAGLGSGASTSLSLDPVLASNQAWQSNIDAANGPLQTAQTALTQISSVASNFFAQIANLNGLNASEIDSVAASARAALQQVAGLLDTTDAGKYVFSGQDSGNPPVPQPDAILSSGFFTSIQTAVNGLATAGAPSVTSDTLSVAASNAAGISPFSALLSQPPSSLTSLRSSVSVGPQQSVPTVMLACANADVASTGTSTTGSYMRDIMRALATLGSLSSSQADTPGFAQVVADTHTSLGDAITALNADAGVMGERQKQLTATQSQLSSVSTALKTQVASVEEVDMTATLSKLTQTQTQLQASYQLIAGQQSLSLVKYLAGG